MGSNPDEILGKLTRTSGFDVASSQIQAWQEEIRTLQQILGSYDGEVYFEYSIPRMGKRIDVVLIIKGVIFILEFKVGEHEFTQHALDQVCDYALDLKYFHEPSHDAFIAPILIATEAKKPPAIHIVLPQNDKLFAPIKSNAELLQPIISKILLSTGGGINKYQTMGSREILPYANNRGGCVSSIPGPFSQ